MRHTCTLNKHGCENHGSLLAVYRVPGVAKEASGGRMGVPAQPDLPGAGRGLGSCERSSSRVGSPNPRQSQHLGSGPYPPASAFFILPSVEGTHWEAPARLRCGPRDGLVEVWRNWGERLGCSGRHAGFGWVAETRETGEGQSRGTAWRVILQARPVTLPSKRARNRVLLSRSRKLGLSCQNFGGSWPRSAKQ